MKAGKWYRGILESAKMFMTRWRVAGRREKIKYLGAARPG